MKNFTDNFSIRDDDPRAIRVKQGGGEQLDGGDLAMSPQHLDVFAHSKRFGEDNRQPRDDVRKHALHGQANTEAGHTDTGNQRGHVHAGRAGCDHQRKNNHQQAQEPHDQHAHRRLQL